jgi:flagellar basal body rod protein FlgB
MLAGAVDDRNARTGGEQGDLRWSETSEVKHAKGDGGLRLEPTTASPNILFHDRNNRDLERTMQDLVENTAVYRMSADLLKSRYDLLRDGNFRAGLRRGSSRSSPRFRP